MKAKKLRFLLVDDHPVVRVGTKQFLAAHFDAEFTEAGNTREAVERCADVDLAIVDVNLPGRSGLDLVTDLQKCCGAKVLVLSMHEETPFARRALKAGARGYVMKSAFATELVEAVRKVLEGGIFISRKLAEDLAHTFVAGESPHRHEMLSAREFEVFRLIASGLAGKEIAAELGLSFKTVSTYRTRVLQKLNLHTNYELLDYARREGLVLPPAT